MLSKCLTKISKKNDLFNDIITFGMHRKWKRFVAQKQTCMMNKVVWTYAVEQVNRT
ncbi:MAG: hypothetical protein CM1200mP28_17810 [Deltaproteobacteria bacterium]|nr:MAG: hypothetical protein CM1200mP28_17810 [Deltaproteobacteria bacterium]